MKSERPTYDVMVQVRAPRFFAAALDAAANSRMMSRSDFVRATLAERLRQDGVDIDQRGAA